MNFVRNTVKNSHINIHDALYRGKTEATKTYYRVEEGKNIHYVSAISLYLYSCECGKFPIGHPKIYVGADCPPDCFVREVITKFKVLPRRKPYHPVLLYKKLQTHVPLGFSLFRRYELGRFTHSDKERSIV